MNLDEIMDRLEEAGKESQRKTHRRHGAKGDLFGVPSADLRSLAKRVGTDHEVARALWTTKNADARLLATMVADPAKSTSAELDRWAKDLDWYAIGDAFTAFVARTAHAAAKRRVWVEADGECIESVGWGLVAQWATTAPESEDAALRPVLARIERDVHGAKNRVRLGMVSALCAIGGRSDALAKEATATAKRIGPVEVDHGDTSCKTPDAVEYIAKMRAHRSRKTAGAGARGKPKTAAART